MDNVLNYKKDGQWYELGEDTPESLAGASYDVSATPDDKVKLYLLTNGDGTLTALLAGKGDTENMAKDGHPWKEYINAITAIVVGKGVTSIGERLFQRHEAVKSLVFEDSGSIKSLGRLAFQGCQMGGEYSFPNLTDTELAQVFSHCPNLEGITLNKNVKSIASPAFTACLSLRYVHGLGGVQTVGLGAFINTPKLESLDLDPAVCTAFAESAFLQSGVAMRYANTSVWENTQIGRNAIPTKSYSQEMLAKIRAVGLPNVVPNEVNVDCQNNYPDMPYCKRNGAPIYIGADGCMAMALYHIFNWKNGAPYANFADWWAAEIIAKNPDIVNTEINSVQAAMADTLGWTVRTGFPVRIKTDPEAAKSAIATELAAGRALAANFGYNSSQGHSVAIVGSNAVTDKLTIADSTRTSGDKGCIYEMSFEQLFGEFDTCMVISYDTEGGGS